MHLIGPCRRGRAGLTSGSSRWRVARCHADRCGRSSPGTRRFPTYATAAPTHSYWKESQHPWLGFPSDTERFEFGVTLMGDR
jgi:hypothetical protein